MTQDFETSVPPFSSPEQPKKKNNALIVTIIVALLLLCCCCAVIVWAGAAFGYEFFQAFDVTY